MDTDSLKGTFDFGMGIEIIKRAKNSREGKTIIANFGYLSLLQIAGYVFPLITMPYLARTLGKEGFGYIAFATAIVTWIQTISDWGFNFTATRDVAKNRKDLQKVSVIFSNVLWARLLLTSICFCFLLILIYFIPTFKDNATIILVTFLMVPAHILCPEWFFQALEKMKYITILNLTVKFIFTIGVFIIIKDKSDYIYQPLLTTIGYAVSGIISITVIRKWGYKLYFPAIKEVLATIIDGFDIFINNLMPNLYNSFSFLLLGIWGSAASTGILDAGNKFVNICIQLMSVVSRVFFPYLSRKIDNHALYAKFSIFVSIGMSVCLFLGAPLAINLFFGEEFKSSILVMQIMSVSNIFLTMNSIYGTGYMLIVGYEKELRNISIASSIAGLLMSFPLIYFYDYLGAAITITATRGIIGFAEYFYYKSIKK